MWRVRLQVVLFAIGLLVSRFLRLIGYGLCRLRLHIWEHVGWQRVPGMQVMNEPVYLCRRWGCEARRVGWRW